MRVTTEPLANRRDPETGERPDFRCMACRSRVGRRGGHVWDVDGVGLILLCYWCAIRIVAAAYGYQPGRS